MVFMDGLMSLYGVVFVGRLNLVYLLLLVMVEFILQGILLME